MGTFKIARVIVGVRLVEGIRIFEFLGIGFFYVLFYVNFIAMEGGDVGIVFRYYFVEVIGV